MSEKCTSNCKTCDKSDCGDRNDFREALNKDSSVNKVIGIVSGKGGVGKSLITSLSAVAMRRLGANVAILDADITGPSIPQGFGLHCQADVDEGNIILPVVTDTGIKVMSINLLLQSETAPVVWRGPVIAGAVKQFWTDVRWGDVDYMFVDMPPGTGDVPLTVFQSLPVEGIVVVASPQDLVGMIVAKAVNMAEKMNIPVLGIVENMSYFRCPDCGKDHYIFGESHVDAVAEEFGIKVLGRLPIDPSVAKAYDAGMIETVGTEVLEDAIDVFKNL